MKLVNKALNKISLLLNLKGLKNRRTKIEGLQQSLYTVELALEDLVEEAIRERES